MNAPAVVLTAEERQQGVHVPDRWLFSETAVEHIVAARTADADARLAAVAALHRRRAFMKLSDFIHFGQTEFPDKCDHCRSTWPCDTAAALSATATATAAGRPEACDGCALRSARKPCGGCPAS